MNNLIANEIGIPARTYRGTHSGWVLSFRGYQLDTPYGIRGTTAVDIIVTNETVTFEPASTEAPPQQCNTREMQRFAGWVRASRFRDGGALELLVRRALATGIDSDAWWAASQEAIQLSNGWM